MQHIVKKCDDKPIVYHDSTRESEIDLLIFVDIIWAERKKIWLSTIFFLLIGLATAFLLPQRWTSQAIITEPKYKQLASLSSALDNLEILGVDKPISADDIYLQFLKGLNSQVLLKKYLQDSDYIKGKLKNDLSDSNQLHKVVDEAANQFAMYINVSDKDKDNKPWQSWKLEFSAPTAIQAQKVLDGFIRYVSSTVQENILDDIRTVVSLHIKNSEDSLKLDIINLSYAHKNKIKRLEYALRIASAAAIKSPIYSNGQALNDDSDYSIALGADGIRQKLDIERKLTDVTAMDTDIENRQYKLKELKAFNLDKVFFKAFDYQQTPSLPITKNSFGRLPIIIIVTVLGMLLSSVIVVLRYVITEYHKQRSGKIS